MSSLHLRKPVRSRSELLFQPRVVKKKQRSRRIPWDNSVNDLTKYKPTPEELERNHVLHLPKKDRSNFTYHSVDEENFDKMPTLAKRKNAFMKEMFAKQEKELQEVLVETDRTMASVQDLFGDDVQKYAAKPHVTRAPNIDDFHQNNNITTYDWTLDPHSRERFGTTLNEISSDSEASDCNVKYQSKLNLQHYEKILEDSKRIAEGESNSNATKRKEDTRPTMNGYHEQPFDDMRQLLDVLENEVAEYEKETGIESAETVQIPSTLTGYTGHLLSAVIRITRQLKHSERQSRNELSMRKEMIDVLEDQRDLINALTADLIDTQETLEQFRTEQRTYNERVEKQVQTLTDNVTNLVKIFGENSTRNDNLFPVNLTAPEKETTIDDKNRISPRISPIHID